MPLRTLKDLYVQTLLKLRRSERRLGELLPQMSQAALARSLRDAFGQQAVRSQQHAARLELIFSSIGLDRGGPVVESRAIDGVVEDGLAIVHEDAEPHVRDAALIALAQELIHEQIAMYGCARSWARLLDDLQAGDALQQILDDLKGLDRQLTQVADTLNPEAVPAQG